MRILRGKSNQEVSSKGFAWFVVGLVLATFFGGAIRTILTSDRVHQRIISELRNRYPQHQFQIEKTEVLLSRGLWPGLGLRLKNLTFRQDVCGKLSFNLEVPQAVLPVNIFSLFKGKVRLGRIELSDGRIHFNYRPCPDEQEASKANGRTAPPRKPMISAPSLDWERASRNLDGLELHNFSLTYERNVTWKILVHSMSVDVDDDLSAKGLLEIQKSLPTGTLSHFVDLDASGDNRVLEWGVRSEFKEGTFKLKGSLDLNSQLMELQVKARQLPMKDIASELHQMGFASKDVRLRAAWLSCELDWNGLFSKPLDMPLTVRECKIEGSYGRVELDEAEVALNRNPIEMKKAATLKVAKLQMQPILEVLGREVLPKVFAKSGVWSGDIQYLNPHAWKVDGHLEGLEVVFSNRSVRGKQIIDSMQTLLKTADNRIEGKLSDIRVRGGEFAGHIDFKLHEDWRNGEFKAQVERLRFSPSIQNLMLGGTVGTLKLDGRGLLQDGELSKWDGELELEQITGEGWQVDGIQLSSRYTPGLFHLMGQAKKARVTPTSPVFSQLTVVKPGEEDVFSWTNLRTEVDVQADRGFLHDLSGYEDENREVWKIRGSWVRDGEFNANLVIGGNRKKIYSLTSEKGALTIQRSNRP